MLQLSFKRTTYWCVDKRLVGGGGDIANSGSREVRRPLCTAVVQAGVVQAGVAVVGEGWELCRW